MKTEHIEILGADEHNLQKVDVRIPKYRLTVFTGVSGSGKSSLAFDTLFHEGQRRYVESLSTYARQFLSQAEKPRYDSIRGLSPTIAIEQKSASSNPRSTVGTVTEVHDHLRVLYARLGRQHCHSCDREVGRADIDQIVDVILRLPEETRCLILAPVVRHRKGEFRDLFKEFQADGFVRVRVDGETYELPDVPELDKKFKHTIEVVVDRLVVRANARARLADSCEVALRLTEGLLVVEPMGDSEPLLFSEHNYCAHCDIAFPELTPQCFSFNSPLGMCSSCNGLGTTFEADPAKIVPDPSLSIGAGAIAPWNNRFIMGGSWTEDIIRGVADAYSIDLDCPFEDLSKTHRRIVLYGVSRRVRVEKRGRNFRGTVNARYEGVAHTIGRRWHETSSERSRRFYEEFMSRRQCSTCEGSRLRPESSAVLFNGHSLIELLGWPVHKAQEFFDALDLVGQRAVIGEELTKEISNRLRFLSNVGLGYLTLDRTAHTLSGGEAQRIRLASQLGNELTGVTYILDEPSIGLHSRDNKALIETLERLRDLGNTVVVVEHDRETIEAADHLIDFGPGAGRHGGTIVYSGPPKKISTSKSSITGDYLTGKREIAVPTTRRSPGGWIRVRNASQNNLKNIDVEIPSGCFVVCTGVSGAGKSTLVNQILGPAAANHLQRGSKRVGAHDGIDGLEQFDKAVVIDQKPIGRTPRSNPATYTKVLDPIRSVFAQTVEARAAGYKPGRFSFNVRGGRCEYCTGDGSLKVEMHFLADVWVNCPRCNGRRFNDATLNVKFKDQSIADVLEMPVDSAVEVFANHPKTARILQTLQDVGLGYIALGQPSTTLSGGEAQRIKLSRELAKRSTGKTLYILDEPTTGLHFDDVAKLLTVIHRLVDGGNTVVMIEHHTDVILNADWIIDLGPEGGESGGRVIAEGPPEEIIRNKKSFTGQILAEAMKGRKQGN
tara:strand:- start:1283 stop:4123 length:2841 start_codon:yes stop_codon:yes gene_type:complete